MSAALSPEFSRPEFSRKADIRQIDEAPVRLIANEAERAALARRFDLVRIDRLEAELALAKDGAAITATGTLHAAIVQSCAISAEDLPGVIDQALVLRFVPAGPPPPPDAEIELAADAPDEIEFTGTSFDLGEAVAQSLFLAIDWFAQGPEADRVRQSAGLLDEAAAGPFAALAALKGKV